MVSAPEPFVIDPRFNGSPGSANGGYAAGLAARALTDGPAEVTLRLPPPLGVPLDVVRTQDGVELQDGGQVVVAATQWHGEVTSPAPPTQPALHAAVRQFDQQLYARNHPFDGCFTCGPARAEDDGLRIFPGSIQESPMVAWPWNPSPSTAGEDGLVNPLILWAALSCPSGLCWVSGPDGTATDFHMDSIVLGRLAVRIDRRPAVGESLVVGAWRRNAVRRKLLGGATVWDGNGVGVASAEATWIVLDPDNAEAFAAKE